MADLNKNFLLPLGNSPFAGRSTNWILTAAALAGSVASSIIGGAKAAKASRKAAREQAYRRESEKAWYDKQYNTDYLDTKAGQNLMRRAQEIQDDYIRKADGAAAVGGGTAASVAQAKEAANKNLGDTVANIAAQDTSRKQQVADTHMQNQMQQSQDRESLENQRAQNVSNAAQNMSNALMTAAGSLEDGVKSQKVSKLSTATGADGTSAVINDAAKHVDLNNLNDAAVQHAQGLTLPATPSPTAQDYANKSNMDSIQEVARRLARRGGVS